MTFDLKAGILVLAFLVAAGAAVYLKLPGEVPGVAIGLAMGIATKFGVIGRRMPEELK